MSDSEQRAVHRRELVERDWALFVASSQAVVNAIDELFPEGHGFFEMKKIVEEKP
jgi:hypothetical protein